MATVEEGRVLCGTQEPLEHYETIVFTNGSKDATLRLRSCFTGGTGGKVWKASEFLARWIYFNPSVVQGLTGKIEHCLPFRSFSRRTRGAVLELGAGLALPSLVAGFFAAKVFASDFITEILGAFAIPLFVVRGSSNEIPVVRKPQFQRPHK
jgi:hypothetical protein